MCRLKLAGGGHAEVAHGHVVKLTLYNSAAREKQVFEPLNPGRVGMYVCGPTVYDYAHIGNARPFVVFDILYRLLKREYETVTYVRNITDVDDKIINAANASGELIGAITARTTKAFQADMVAVGNLEPDVEPAATEHIPQMVAMIESLIAKGHGYEAEGHVLFTVESMSAYGRFSGRDCNEMIAGARVEVASYKRDPADFIMWKPSAPDQPGWESPWGRGRPGWHIECSAMSEEYLGETFDIHGGGRDLLFPHHENEVAQSTCAHNGALLARYWVHNGFVTVDGEKMAKSVGNVRTVRSLLQDHPGEAIRLALLGAQYRQPMDWTDDALAQAQKSLNRWYRAAANSDDGEVQDSVLNPMLDDLNTAEAIAALHRLADAALAGGTQAAADLRASAGLMGLLQTDVDSWFHAATGIRLDIPEIESLIERRTAARRNRDFVEADRIRAELEASGVVLEDAAGETTWRRAV